MAEMVANDSVTAEHGILYVYLWEVSVCICVRLRLRFPGSCAALGNMVVFFVIQMDALVLSGVRSANRAI